jgi:hypothetical protein
MKHDSYHSSIGRRGDGSSTSNNNNNNIKHSHENLYGLTKDIARNKFARDFKYESDEIKQRRLDKYQEFLNRESGINDHESADYLLTHSSKNVYSLNSFFSFNKSRSQNIKEFISHVEDIIKLRGGSAKSIYFGETTKNQHNNSLDGGGGDDKRKLHREEYEESSGDNDDYDINSLFKFKYTITDFKKEVVIGLSDHSNGSVVSEKFIHAPIPQEFFSSSGIRNSFYHQLYSSLYAKINTNDKHKRKKVDQNNKKKKEELILLLTKLEKLRRSTREIDKKEDELILSINHKEMSEYTSNHFYTTSMNDLQETVLRNSSKGDFIDKFMEDLSYFYLWPIVYNPSCKEKKKKKKKEQYYVKHKTFLCVTMNPFFLLQLCLCTKE